MKKVLALFLLGSLLLLVQPYAVSAETTVWPRAILIECTPSFSVSPSPAAYTGLVTITWEDSSDCAATADSVRIVFGASNPWYQNQVVTFTVVPGGDVTSGTTARKGEFYYKVIRYFGGSAVDTVDATVAIGATRVPSLSTWAALVLALAVIAVSIGLLRRRKMILT